jgi:hypothetical protein
MVTNEQGGTGEMAIDGGNKMVDSMSSNAVVFLKQTGFHGKVTGE